MKVLLTGASGFVGRQILRSLADMNAKVRVVVRPGGQERLEKSEVIETVVTCPDLFAQDAAWWAGACEDADTVIHAAWYAEPGEYLQSAKNLDCLGGTLQLAKGAVRAGVRKFVGLGTCFEYDLEKGVLSVDTPLRPTTVYAGSKAAAFFSLTQYLPSQGVNFAWCRLFYLYGEGEDERRLIPYVRARLAAGEPVELTTGTQVRDFLDVREAGRMIADVTRSEALGAVNICSGIPVTVRALVETIADEYGRRDLLRFGVRPENLVDPPCVLGVRTIKRHEAQEKEII